MSYFVERRTEDGWEGVAPAEWGATEWSVNAWEGPSFPIAHSHRNYGLFGILADVRNYSGFTPIKPWEKWPDDHTRKRRPSCFSDELGDGWERGISTWYYAQELLDFDWDTPALNRRNDGHDPPNWGTGPYTAPEGQGEPTTYREEVGESFLAEVAAIRALHPDPLGVRILMGFD